MNVAEIIRKKRNNSELSSEEIKFLIKNYSEDKIPDYQMSAFLMAVYLNGMNEKEIFELTSSYINSGKKIDLNFLNGPKVDKHSTGGVGDKVSIILAPLVASCGVYVPMISGRGLGHTGGTLDKLESIPNFKTNISIEEFKNILSTTSVAMSGQSSELVPADKKIYALRDVTSTVESLPLIVASIMSKKIAEGIDSLVLDIKFGNGAVFSDYNRALELAKELIKVGNSYGIKVVAYLTSMEEPLGSMIGNWLEVVESVLCLKGKNVPDLMNVTLTLSAELLCLSGKTKTFKEALNLCKMQIENGSAYRKFLEIVNAQGGDVEIFEDFSKYPKSKYIFPIPVEKSGFITGINTRELGLIANEAGAGRTKLSDKVDPKAGIVLSKKIGENVKKGEFIATLYTDIDDKRFVEKVQNTFTIESEKQNKPPLIKSRITINGVEELNLS